MLTSLTGSISSLFWGKVKRLSYMFLRYAGAEGPTIGLGIFWVLAGTAFWAHKPRHDHARMMSFLLLFVPAQIVYGCCGCSILHFLFSSICLMLYFVLGAWYVTCAAVNVLFAQFLMGGAVEQTAIGSMLSSYIVTGVQIGCLVLAVLHVKWSEDDQKERRRRLRRALELSPVDSD